MKEEIEEAIVAELRTLLVKGPLPFDQNSHFAILSIIEHVRKRYTDPPEVTVRYDLVTRALVVTVL